MKIAVNSFLILFLTGMIGFVFGQKLDERIIRLEPKPWGPIIWPSEVPEGCPVPLSEEWVAIEFTGRSADYTYADTWYPSWASDGNLYSPYTDGVSGIWALARSSAADRAVAGHAKIEGKNPLRLKITPLGAYPGSSLPYGGRYPSANLVHNGIWYYGTYCVDSKPAGYNWGTLGPFVGFRISYDYGRSWQDGPHTPSSPLFGESGKDGNVVKIGTPHFVDFGKNMRYSPDGKAYLVAHGSVREDPLPRPANNSWINGDQIYLLRVLPSLETINNLNAYEFYGGMDAEGTPIWTSDFSKIRPLFEWNNRCGCVTITYNPKLKKYIMCITDGWPTIKFMNTYLMESDRIEGPWKMITFMKDFGEQGYFVNIPSKFIGGDGSHAWLCYSGNFAPFSDLGVNPPGGRYGMILQEFNFLTREQLATYPHRKIQRELQQRQREWEARNPLTDPSRNLALSATVQASSVEEGYTAEAVRDGIVAGFPNHPENEWASRRQGVNAWIRLKWDKKVAIDRIWLFDRPTHNEHILAGGIYMSDGTTLTFGELPNSEYAGKEIRLRRREVEWIEIVIQGVGRCHSIGLSEIAVFGDI